MNKSLRIRHMRIKCMNLSDFSNGENVSPHFRLNDAQRFVEQIIMIINSETRTKNKRHSSYSKSTSLILEYLFPNCTTMPNTMGYKICVMYTMCRQQKRTELSISLSEWIEPTENSHAFIHTWKSFTATAALLVLRLVGLCFKTNPLK